MRAPWLAPFVTVSVLFISACFARPGDADILLLAVKNARLRDQKNMIRDWIVLENDNRSVCNWTGIRCDPTTKEIVGIDFTGFGIAGRFPADFCRISTLRSLVLAYNRFNGSVSSNAMSLCSRLQHLDLSSNLFYGNLPEFTSESSTLVSLNFTLNSFAGDIPASYGRLALLEILCLYGNSLEGPIPVFLGNITGLTRLELGYNPFRPAPLPAEIGNLTNLQNLWLADANLVGEIPATLGRLTSLQNLDLSSNRLSGRIPSSIGALKSLWQLEVYSNNLAGELPESLANLTALINLDASQNNLVGRIPEKLASLPLESLNLNDNFLEGPIPRGISLNPNLIQLKLFNNSFSGELPRDLGRHSAIEELDVSTNGLTGGLPEYLCSRRSLQRLITFSNRLSGTLPSSYGNCSSLSYVRISNNHFSGDIPARFWTLPSLQFLELENNGFRGPIRPSILHARSLKNLLLSNNEFSGEIPPEICALEGLVAIDASLNRFTGTIPACLTELEKLQKLNLRKNNLTGGIVVVLRRKNSWNELTDINLSENDLSGEIPAAMGDLGVLTYLDLSGNALTGVIPSSLTKLRLNKLNLSDNDLEGRVPDGFDSPGFMKSLTGNPKLCSPEPDRLPRCRHRRNHKFGMLLTVMVATLAAIIAFLIVEMWKVLAGRKRGSWEVMPFERVGFTKKELVLSLTDENLIGVGGSGEVYRVQLQSGEVVAAKRLWDGSRRPETEEVFRSEIGTVGRIRHSNIVKLLCSCSFESFRILVYEYMENGSLGDTLHGKKGGRLLDWPTRYRIAVGASQGMAYLHHDCNPPILHRDIKPNNILLDRNFSPRLADFGLARMMEKDKGGGGGRTASVVAGSYGYIAPEYGYTTKVDEKSDVYSLGVVLMELVTGRSPNDPFFDGSRSIVSWVREVAGMLPISGDRSYEEDSDVVEWTRRLVDPRLDRSLCDSGQVELVLNVAMLCTVALPVNRPSMRTVAELLRSGQSSFSK